MEVLAEKQQEEHEMAELVEDKLERLEREELEQQARGENLMSKNLTPNLFDMEIRKLEADDFLKKTMIKIDRSYDIGPSRMIIFGRLKRYNRMLSVSRDKTDPKRKPTMFQHVSSQEKGEYPNC